MSDLLLVIPLFLLALLGLTNKAPAEAAKMTDEDYKQLQETAW